MRGVVLIQPVIQPLVTVFVRYDDYLWLMRGVVLIQPVIQPLVIVFVRYDDYLWKGNIVRQETFDEFRLDNVRHQKLTLKGQQDNSEDIGKKWFLNVILEHVKL